MMKYYDTLNDEVITIEDGYAVVYDNEGFSKMIMEVKEGDEEKVVEMMEDNSARYVSFHNT